MLLKMSAKQESGEKKDLFGMMTRLPKQVTLGDTIIGEFHRIPLVVYVQIQE
jgi:hypothetical protein